MDTDGPALLRELADQIEAERARVRQLEALVREAVEQLPAWAWAGAGDGAHEWHARANAVLNGETGE